ncbi:major capsid protein [Rosenbergiella epipactidis]|uniref:major capsid protein n=1 Tax=Rosenbergiella epipactidis TaxID=1544694 RepID=UPI001F4E0235|nr:major capsid protein [Rosenbergiella epipactidis]
MSTTQISDVIVPTEFTNYLVLNTLVKSALFQSGVATTNALISSQLSAGADQFTVPYWNDLADDEADIVSDDPSVLSTPKKIGTTKQLVRKSYLHQSWSAMNLASELSGSNALNRIQSRAAAYWTRQSQTRIISILKGVMAENVANHGSDMVYDASTEVLNATNVIRAASTLGDSMGSVKGIAMHSKCYTQLLENDLIDFIRDSDGSLVMTTYRGLGVIVDDALVADDKGIYTSILFGAGAIGYAIAAPRIAAGTEIENKPDAGNGGGQQILHTRLNMAFQPLGYSWVESSVAAESPTPAELANAANWKRIVDDRRAIPLAFLLTKG